MTTDLSRRGFFSRMIHPLRPTPAVVESAQPVTAKVAIVQGRHCLAYHSICSVCSERCPEPQAIRVERGIPMINPMACTGCNICHDVCPAPVNAILMLPRIPTPNR